MFASRDRETSDLPPRVEQSKVKSSASILLQCCSASILLQCYKMCKRFGKVCFKVLSHINFSITKMISIR